MRNTEKNLPQRHGMQPVEADRLLQQISENWNLSTGICESVTPHHLQAYGRRQLTAIASRLVLLQEKFSYEQIMTELRHLASGLVMRMAYSPCTGAARRNMAAQHRVISELLDLFIFLKANTYNR